MSELERFVRSLLKVVAVVLCLFVVTSLLKSCM
nr:MAG TPA: hypothetical protein [Microviridae sp.]